MSVRLFLAKNLDCGDIEQELKKIAPVFQEKAFVSKKGVSVPVAIVLSNIILKLGNYVRSC